MPHGRVQISLGGVTGECPRHIVRACGFRDGVIVRSPRVNDSELVFVGADDAGIMPPVVEGIAV
jgi:hypothetical protein